MKPPAAGKREDIGRDAAPKLDDSVAHFLQVRMVEHDQNTAGIGSVFSICTRKTAADTSIVKRNVIGPVVGKLPAQQTFEKVLRALKVARLKFNVVDLVGRGRIHPPIISGELRRRNLKQREQQYDRLAVRFAREKELLVLAGERHVDVSFVGSRAAALAP